MESVPFRLENDETPARHAPAAMAGGVAVFDYNNDGLPDVFFTNGANIETLKKDAPKYSNRLFRNDGGGKFTDVTAAAGLAGTGYDIGVAVADYDNDGYADLFVAGVGANKLYHNNHDGTFTDVTAKAGLNRLDPEYGPMWAVAGAWVDVNNDGLLDLFVVDYLQWNLATEPVCSFRGISHYCHPKDYKGLPNRLYINKGDGTFTDASESSGLRTVIGKGMSVGVADYDGDGRQDLFVPNDTTYNFLFHNVGGGKFKEVGFDAGVALPENGNLISGMGSDFRDLNNDGWPDVVLTALNNQTFPIYKNTGKGDFEEITSTSGMSALTRAMSGYGIGIFDLDNDGWKDLFIARGHIDAESSAGETIDQFNTVMRNLGSVAKWSALTEEAGLNASPAARHRGCAFGDLDRDGRTDVVVTALGRPAEIWMNRSPGSGHWLDVSLRGTRSNRDGIGAVVKVVTKSGSQWNHMTTSVGYASSSDGPVHFGLGADPIASSVEIRWPSETVQRLENVRADRVISITEPAR
ncbi:MAG TPA: CRTAC1 family protein [Bryobacteraceae bacterium]|nr:CRTAC1 family protein [Bryobacteraceae bacterium]